MEVGGRDDRYIYCGGSYVSMHMSKSITLHQKE